MKKNRKIFFGRHRLRSKQGWDRTIEKENKAEWLSDSLQTVVGGTSFVFVGSLVSSLFLFLNTILIARFWTAKELGIFTLAFSILQVFASIGIFGLDRCLTRNVAFEKGKKTDEKIPSIAFTSIILTAAISIIISLILLFFSDYISLHIFDEKNLIIPLIILAFVLPFLNIITVLVSVFRGLNNIKPLVYFQQIMYSFFVIAAIVVVIILKISFIYIFYGYLFSTCVTLLALGIYSLKKFEIIKKFKGFNFDYDVAKKLLLFSIPLLTISLLQKMNIWTNNFLIGFLKDVSSVGLYNIAFFLSGFLTFPIGVLLVMYMPVASNLYGRKKFNEINRVYTILTKWLCFFTFPLFLFIFLFPEFIIGTIYGINYVPAADTLRILAFAGIIINFSGPNGATLISIGKPRLVMYAILSAVLFNISLNIILIPKYGILGAAISTALSVFIFNFIKSIFLYNFINLKPINLNLIKPTVVLSLVSFGLFYLLKCFFVFDYWKILLHLLIFYILYFLFFVLTKSIELEDIQLIEFLYKKIGIKNGFLIKILKNRKRDI